MWELIKNLNWRYATKSFDSSKKVSKEDLEEIIEVFRLTPSSFGLEPWKLVIVENQELKDKLVEHSYWQKQVSEASHLLVFTRVTDTLSQIDKFLENNSKITWASREDLKGYEDMMKWYFGNMDENSNKLWWDNQVNIALWNVMNFIAQKHIDSCALGWFNPEKYDELLNLKEKGLTSVVVLPIGYRNENDKYSKYPKVRFSKEEISEII